MQKTYGPNRGIICDKRLSMNFNARIIVVRKQRREDTFDTTQTLSGQQPTLNQPLATRATSLRYNQSIC